MYEIRESVSHSVVSDSLQPHGLWPTRLLHQWDSPGKSIGVGCRFLHQEVFPSQGSNPGLPHCRQTFYTLSHQGNPFQYKWKYLIFFQLWLSSCVCVYTPLSPRHRQFSWCAHWLFETNLVRNKGEECSFIYFPKAEECWPHIDDAIQSFITL